MSIYRGTVEMLGVGTNAYEIAKIGKFYFYSHPSKFKLKLLQSAYNKGEQVEIFPDTNKKMTKKLQILLNGKIVQVNVMKINLISVYKKTHESHIQNNLPGQKVY